jgi:hydroxymethylglutaryl-CoA synthase
MTSGIRGYGVAIPRRRIAIEEINNVWKNLPIQTVKGRKVKERGVLGPDEDTVTLGADAAYKAIKMSGLDREKIGALILGTQTSPYHTRPAASILVDALGLRNEVFAADIQFSGKSGTSALLIALAYVNSGMAEAAIAIGSDTLSYHVSPGDSQEYVASSGACAVVVGRGAGIAEIEKSASYTTDTPDYFRLDGERYIRTGGSAMTATGVGMQENMVGAWESLNRDRVYTPNSFRYLAIQQEDGKAPFQVGQKLGFSKEQITPGIISDYLGDCGAASALISLAKVLDTAEADEKIVVLSYGSGAGSDILVVKTTSKIREISRKPSTGELISQKAMVDYSTYIKLERKYDTHERKVSTFD